MNVIPPTSKGGATGPQTISEDGMRSRGGMTIEDLTPPMQKDEPDSKPAVNEPRIIAQAADVVRGTLQQEIGELFKTVDNLVKRIETIETALPSGNQRQPDIHPIIRRDQDGGNVAESGANSGYFAKPSESGYFAEPGKDSGYSAKPGESGYSAKPGNDSGYSADPDHPDVQATTYKAQPHSVAEEVREIEFRRGIDGVEQLRQSSGRPFVVSGSPRLYRGVFLRGYTKASENAEWMLMTVEQEVAVAPGEWKLESDVVGTPYPWTNVLRPTWDTQRFADSP